MEIGLFELLVMTAHVALGFIVTVLIVVCPVRTGYEKFLSLLIIWCIPVLGSIYVYCRVGTKRIKRRRSGGHYSGYTSGGGGYCDGGSSGGGGYSGGGSCGGGDGGGCGGGD
ncbi:hypothetical protein [Thaumasiovibrio subtropicus]|uniref:hypothetical protein n=1 Tax=Thaumasiovibrio subtropicus TaxID=1891207 RepID=UPI0018649470|nr:hypothetical protein [Thaumasiovibrio subtropicus]